MSDPIHKANCPYDGEYWGCTCGAVTDDPVRDHVDTLFEEANSGFGSGSESIKSSEQS